MNHQAVLVIGVFDLFHRGHVELLKAAKALGDKLIVVINGDAFTTSYKRSPIFSEADRAALVAAMRDVDVTIVSNSPDARPIIERFGITCIVHGDDWDHESYMQQICIDEAYRASHSIEMKYLPYYTGISTSEIIRRVRERE